MLLQGETRQWQWHLVILCIFSSLPRENKSQEPLPAYASCHYQKANISNLNVKKNALIYWQCVTFHLKASRSEVTWTAAIRIQEKTTRERRACVSFLRTTWEQKTRPSSVHRCDSWGMFGCTSNTLSVVAKIEQPSKAPRPTAEKRIKSFHERRAKKRCCCSAYAASFLYLALFCSGVTHGQSEFWRVLFGNVRQPFKRQRATLRPSAVVKT